MYRRIIMLLLCMYSISVYAQGDCKLSVDVLVSEKHNGQPVYPLTVHIDELQREFETNEKGRFTISDICEGTYTLHFHAYSYEHAVEQVTIKKSGELKFRIGHEEHIMKEVTVATERNQTLLQDKDALNKQDIAANSGKNLADMLKNVNGVNAISNGATIAKPVIHGLHSNRIVLLNNGVRQEDQQWGGEHAPNIDPFLAGNITVVKGAASVKYGTDAIAGVVLVEPAPLRRMAGTDAELNLAGFSNNRMGVASATVNHNFKQLPALSLRAQGTFKKGGNYRVPGYWVANTGVQEADYSGAIGWNKLHYGAEVFYSHFETDLGIYRGSHTGNQADLEAAIRSDKPLVPAGFTYDIARPRQHVLHDLAKVKLYRDSKVGMFHLVYGYQHNFRQEYDVLRKEVPEAQLNVTLNTQTLNLNLEHRSIGVLAGEVGVDGVQQENFIQPGDRVFIPNYRSKGGAAYAIERYKGDDWTLEGGLRYDYRWYEMFNPEGKSQQVVRYEFDYNSVSGTLGLNKQVRDNWNVSVTASNAWRAPQPNELFSSGFHHGAARVELGDKTLKPERSYNLNVASKYSWGKLSTDLSLYTQYINNFIYLEPGADLLTIRGYYKTFTYKQTNAHLSGADITGTYAWTGKWESTLKGSFLFARTTKAKDWLILMPADRLSLNTTYKTDIGKRLQECSISIDAKYVFNQYRIPRNFDSIDYPRPPQAYFLADASIGAKLNAGKQPVYLSLSIMNIFNQKYREYLDAFRYFIDQPGTNLALRIRVPIQFNNQQKDQ